MSAFSVNGMFITETDVGYTITENPETIIVAFQQHRNCKIYFTLAYLS